MCYWFYGDTRLDHHLTMITGSIHHHPRRFKLLNPNPPDDDKNGNIF
jgi:hypothetical protein